MRPPSTAGAGWRQLYIRIADGTQAEATLLTHLAPIFNAAQDTGAITSWWITRKPPCLRIRYLPTGEPDAHLLRQIDALQSQRHLVEVTEVIYEPETHAFGGATAMAIAHRLFARDTQRMLRYLSRADRSGPDHRREMSIMLCSAMLGAADLDWYEQGDVWTRVAAHRQPPCLPADAYLRLRTSLRRLMTVDTTKLTGDTAAALAGWAQAFIDAGHDLAALANEGELGRGLRAVLAHHIIFAWNRHGLPLTTQAVLAHTATAVVFTDHPQADEQQVP
jgi:thiopeptide-type bacteriocin biosynthesis protein